MPLALSLSNTHAAPHSADYPEEVHLEVHNEARYIVGH